jgi:hypothetical protein
MRSSFQQNFRGTEQQFAPSDWALPLELPPPIVEVLAVTTQPEAGLLVAQSLDAPRPGYESDSYVLPVAGWLRHPESAVVRVHIEADRRRV